MTCQPLVDPAGCLAALATGAAKKTAAAAAQAAVGGLEARLQSLVSWTVTNSMDWWVKTGSPDLSGEQAVTSLRAWILPLAGATAAAGMIGAGIRMTLSRRHAPEAAAGAAMGLAVLVAVTAIGVLVPDVLLQAGDAWTTWILQQAAGSKGLAARMNDLMAATSVAGVPGALVAALDVVAVIVGLLQWVLMMFRDASLVVLAAMLPLAAAGTVTTATRPWFRRVTGWMAALIFYKPAAAAVYAAAFTLTGTSRSPSMIIAGFAMMLLSLVALPALMRFFTWTTGEVTGVSGGGFLQAASGAVAAGSTMRAFSGMGGAMGAAPAAESSGPGPASPGAAGAKDAGGTSPAGAPGGGPGSPPGPGGSGPGGSAGGSAAGGAPAGPGGAAQAGQAAAGGVSTAAATGPAGAAAAAVRVAGQGKHAAAYAFTGQGPAAPPDGAAS